LQEFNNGEDVIREELTMRKAILGMFVLALMMCMPVLAQQSDTDQGKMGHESMKGDKASTKPHHIKGTIGDDGKTFTSDKDKKSWTIQNPDAVKGHEGHHVIVNAEIYPDKNEIEVVSLKMASTSASKMKDDHKDQMKY
jgi:hypothetical protein